MAAKHRADDRSIHRPVQAGATVEPEKDCAVHEKPEPQEGTAPHCGRTGDQGARAERPSEGSLRKGSEKAPHTGRGGKAPTADSAPHSEERSSR